MAPLVIGRDGTPERSQPDRVVPVSLSADSADLARRARRVHGNRGRVALIVQAPVTEPTPAPAKPDFKAGKDQ